MTNTPNDPPNIPPAPPPESEHAWIHDHLATYLADGLDAAERQRFDAHINACSDCFDAFTEARDADRLLQRTLGTLAPSPTAPVLEDRLITHFREKTMTSHKRYFIRRASYATAAAIALAATGVFANYAIHQNGRFNNAVSRELVARADTAEPDFATPIDHLKSLMVSRSQLSGGPPATSDNRMVFNFDKQPLSAILDQMSKQFGMTILRPATPIPGTVTIKVKEPLSLAEGTKLLNSILVPLGYASREIQVQGSDKMGLQIYTVAEAKKASMPVFEGSDPDDIPLSDELRTQVIPLTNIDAVRLRNDVSQLVSADADVTANPGSNSIVVTDTSAHIKRLTEIISKLDKATVSKTSIATKQLQNANAADAARLINNTNSIASMSAPTGGAGGFGGGGGRGAAQSTPHVYADSDARTNTVVLNGPDAGVKDAMATLASLDQRAAGTTETMRQNVDGAEHLTPYKDLTVAAASPSANVFAPTFGIADTAGKGDIGFEFGANTPAAFSAGAGASTSTGTVYLNGGTAKFVTSGSAITTDGSTININGNTAIASGGLVTDGPSAFQARDIRRGNVIVDNGTVNSGDAFFKMAVTGGVNGGGQPGVISTLGTKAADGRFAVDNGTNSANIVSAGAGAPAGGPPAARDQSGPGQTVASAEGLAGGVVEFGNLNTLNKALPARSNPGQSTATGDGNGLVSAGLIHKADVAGQSEESKNLKLVPNAVQPGTWEDDMKGMRAGGTSTGDPNAARARELAARKLSEQIASTDSRANYTFDFPAEAVPSQRVIIPIAATTAPAAAPTPQAAAAASAQKVIYNGTVEYEVRSFDDTYATVSDIARQEGGFVSAASSDKLANGKVRGSIVVRIPPEHLQRFLLEIRALGDVKSSQIGSTNISKEYTDTESELRGLRTMETRLLDLIKTGKGEVKDLIEAETKLGDVRIRLEKLEGELHYYDNLVSMATLNITAYEKDIQSPTAASEQENVNVSLETEEVEAKYQAARKILDDAKARIVDSQLKNTDADHIAATITADVPPDQADFVAAQLKQLGKVSAFSRDRHQTTAGGTGAPEPHVQVEKKDTRFGISLYNLANLAPRETTVLTVAVSDVQATYKKILSLVRQDAATGPATTADATTQPAPPVIHPSGRIIASGLNGQLPDQMSADVRAELRTDGAGANADAILQAIRDSGEVLTSTLAENPDNANSTSAKRGIQLRLVNIASVPPKEAVTLNVAVRDVESSYKKIIALIQKPAESPAPPGAPAAVNIAGPTVGRLLANNVNGQVPEQMTADIRAEIRADQADSVLQAMRDAGEVISSTTTQNPDTSGNVTRSKEGIQLRFINVASVAARETQTLRVVAADVTASYNKLLASLQAIADAGGGGNGGARVISSHLNESDPRTISASLQFEARRDALSQIDKAFADAGIDFLSRTINRATNTAGTLDSKIYFQIDELKSAEALDPRRTFTMGLEVDNVERALETLRSSVAGTPVKEMDFSTAKEASGRVTGHIVLDAPTANTIALLARIRDLGGIERDNQVSNNAQVPDTRFSKDRIDLTLTSRTAIVQADQGLWPDYPRRALSSASGALIYSLYLVLTGLFFILPFALIIWPLWRIARRRKASA